MSNKSFTIVTSSYDRGQTTLSFVGEPDKCPVCGRGQSCKPHYARETKSGICFAYFQCVLDNCRAPFFGSYEKRGDNRYYFVDTQVPNYTEETEEVPELIKTISPNYSQIYNQSAQAEDKGFDLIVGCGYRKALEFLIKDYSILLIKGDSKDEELSEEDKEKIEKIKKANLAKVIKDYLNMPKVQALASRATWLGNDETHYERRLEKGDVSVMKRLMRLVIHFIEAEEEAKKLEEEIQPA